MPARPDPDVKIRRSIGLNLSLYVIFHGDFEKKTLEKHISKQMRVYKQITFFIKKSKILKICFPDRKMDFLRGGPIFGKVTLEPLKKIWDLYQSIRLEKSVSKMGFLHLICWTNDHFIKKQWIFQRETRFSRVRIFEIFENLDFGTFDHCILYSFLRGFSLWQRGIDSTKQMTVYDQITFFIKFSILFFDFQIFLRMQKT